MYLDSPSAILWNRVMLSGLVAMPLTFFAFVRGFLRLERSPAPLYLGSVALLALWVLNARGYLTTYLHFTANGLLLYEFGPAFPIFATNSALFLGLAAVYLIRGYRETKDPIDRNRLRYAFLGISVVMLGSSTNLIPTLGAYPIDIAGNIINALLLAYAIFRYQLLDISVVVRRGVLYSIPTIIISAGYLFTVFLAVNLFHNVAGYEMLLLSVVIAAVIAVVSQPLRDKLQDGVDKLFFREKHDAGLMLQKLSQTATTVIDLDRLTNMILDEIAAAMHPTKSAVLLPGLESGKFIVVNQRGLAQADVSLRWDHPLVAWLSSHRTALTWREAEVLPQFRALWTEEREALIQIEAELFVPLPSREGLIGILILGAKRAELPYSPDEQRTLSTLANQMAIAIENARLFAEERKRATQLALLSGVGRKSAVLDLDKLMQEVASSIRDGFHYHSVSIFMIDEKRHEVVMQVMAGGLKPMVPEAYRQSWDEGIIGFVARTGSARLANDISQDPCYVKGRVEHPITKAELCVPIKLGHKAIGVLDVQSVHLNSFNQADVVTMEALSDWLAIAIENARLYQETRQRAEQMDGLYNIGLAIGSQLNLDTLLHSIVEQAVELLGGAMGGLYLYRPERDVLEWVTAVGSRLAPLGTILRRGEGLSGKVWETGRPLLVDDYQHWAGRADVYNGQPYGAVVGVPVCWGDEFLGVLNVNVLSGTPRTFSPADADLLNLFATQAAIAIKNARLYEAAQQELSVRKQTQEALQKAHAELGRRVEELSTMQEVARDLNASLDLDRVPDLVLERAIQVTPAHAGAITLLDKERGGLFIAAMQDFPPHIGIYRFQPWPLEQGIIGWVARTGQPSLVADVTQDPRYVPVLPSTRSQLTVPLLANMQVIGVIALESSQVAGFDEEHIHYLSSLADQAAIAIQNAQLHSQAEESATAEERTRIAREMHDGLVQDLAALVQLGINPSAV